jgi:hypothetical protein
MTVGLDGSVWAGGKVLDKPNGSYIGGWVQQVKNLNGVWTPQDRVLLGQDADIDGPRIWLTRYPSRDGKRMTTGLDGSIWLLCEPPVGQEQGAVMRMVQENGTWAPKETILVEKYPISVTTAIDGSIWVVSNSGNVAFGFDPGSVQRIVQGGDGNWFVDGDPIRIDIRPIDITAGLDGSIWVTSDPSPGSLQRIVKFPDGKWNVAGTALHVNDGRSDVRVWSLTTGIDGSIWVSSGQSGGFHGGHVQRIVNEHGEWFVKGPEIGVDNFAYLKAGHDGSIWTLGAESKAAQHIVNERGTWFVKGDPIRLQEPQFFAAGSDGSMWYGNRSGALEQIWTNPAAPTDLSAVADRTAGKATLSWNAPAFNGGTPVLSYAVTARQGSIIQTDTNWGDTAYTFSGLDFSKGPVYFTVAATNFAGTSPVATLLIGQDGKTIDTTHLTTGITTDGTWVIGDGFDTLGQTYSWEALGSGKPIPFGNVRFDLGSPNQPGTIIAAGQSIEVPQGAYSSINLAGASVYYGAQPNLVFTLNYTDGTTETWTQSISDWVFSANYSGEQKIATSSYYNRNDGTKGQQSVNIYGYNRAIPQGKTLKSITLPQNQNVRILDIKMGN